MTVFEQMSKRDHEQVIHCYDEESGLRAIIAIHNTTLGPALGGCRMWNYETRPMRSKTYSVSRGA
jgi:leucine dehydrogenase